MTLLLIVLFIVNGVLAFWGIASNRSNLTISLNAFAAVMCIAALVFRAL